jgi:hypothetical protein
VSTHHWHVVVVVVVVTSSQSSSRCRDSVLLIIIASTFGTCVVVIQLVMATGVVVTAVTYKHTQGHDSHDDQQSNHDQSLPLWLLDSAMVIVESSTPTAAVITAAIIVQFKCGYSTISVTAITSSAGRIIGNTPGIRRSSGSQG